MKIALFGAGAIAREHALAIRQISFSDSRFAFQVAGVYAPRAEAARTFAAELEIPSSSDDPRVFLADPTIEAIFVCSPSAMHVPQTRAALLAGKHVLCEIPLALSVAEALELRDLAARQQRMLMVAHTLRFHPALVAAREEVAGARLDPVSVVARYLFLRRANIGWTGYRRSWTDNLLWHHGGHAVDMTLWLLGAESIRVASEVALAPPGRESPLDLGIVLRTSRGSVATIALSYSSERAIHDYTIIGREATLHATPEELVRSDGRSVSVRAEESPIVIQDRAFLEAVRYDKPVPISVDDILPSLRVLQAVSDTTSIWPTSEERTQAEIAAASLDAGSNP
jgi:2-hydroxy-4-carboxymuconate semialdehyde hemiacetal dehydrogenase